MSSATSLYHPGLVFATLVVQLTLANGSPVPAVSPRKDCSDCDDDADDFLTKIVARKNGNSDPSECATEGHDCPPSGTGPPNTSTTHPSQTTPAQNTTASGTTSLTTTGTSTLMTFTSPTPTPTNTPTPQLPDTTPHIRMNITTGGIIGVAFGAFVIVAATLIILAACLRRRRRLTDHPQGFAPPSYLASTSGISSQVPPREMSQTQSNPLILSAVASRLRPSSPRNYSHSATTSSLSPLIPAASLEHSPSMTSSSNRRTSLSYTDGGSSHEAAHSHSTQEVQAPTSSWGTMSGFAGGLAGIILGSTTPPAPVPEPSNLVRSMTAYQKSLETEDQKSGQSGSSTSGNGPKQEEQDITEGQDPPPRYDA